MCIIAIITTYIYVCQAFLWVIYIDHHKNPLFDTISKIILYLGGGGVNQRVKEMCPKPQIVIKRTHEVWLYIQIFPSRNKCYLQLYESRIVEFVIIYDSCNLFCLNSVNLKKITIRRNWSYHNKVNEFGALPCKFSMEDKIFRLLIS